MLPEILKKSPFHERLAPRNINEGWERWAGYLSPSTLISETEEYFAVRTASSLYDVSPMYKYRVTGPDAAKAVNRMMTRDIDRLKPNRVAYSPWCDSKGRVIEEGTVFRFGENDFRINAAEQQLTWIEENAFGMQVEVRDVTEEMAGIALQGPLSREVLKDIGLKQAAELTYFSIGDYTLDGYGITVSRTGFTGDLGYELWVAPENAVKLFDRLIALEKTRYIKPIGSHALNTTRIEAGHILINVEYASATTAVREHETRTPFGLALDWAVDFRKAHFTGRSALLKLKEAGGPSQKLVGLEITGKHPAHGAFVYSGSKEVGQITSATWSPVTKRNIAIATVDARYADPGTELMAEIYYVQEVTQKRVEAKATVMDHHFYKPAHKTAKI